MSKKFYQVCEPFLNGNESKYVNECLKTNWISSSGEYIEKFEKKFAEFCNVKYGVGCCNGTVALHLAIEALGIGFGDEVIVPSFSMIASSNAVIYSGAKPVFVDSELKTWNMNPSKIEEKITSKTKAIMVMHTYGHPCDMDPIIKIARKHNLYIIEDAAEAHGAMYKGKIIGSLGDVACFSFYSNKIITTGEGGMIVTNNEKVAEKMRSKRSHCFSKVRFIHDDLGYNYRITNIQAALGLAQLEKINDYIEARIRNAKTYNSFLKDVDGITLPPESKDVKNVFWMYGILIDKDKFGMSAKELMDALKENGIETRAFFYPLNKQPFYIKNEKNDIRYPDFKDDCPNAEFLWNNGLYLPSSSNLTKEDIEHISKTVISLKK